MAEYQCDVVIVGGGLAGMMAALAAKRQGAKVLLLDRTGVGLGNNTTLSGARFTCPRPGYSFEDYVADTIRLGKGLCLPHRVRWIGEKGPEAMAELRGLGVPLADLPEGYRVDAPDDRPSRGALLTQTVAAGLRGEGFSSLPGVLVSQVVADGRALGIRGLHEKAGEVVVKAPAVVLAGGGAGAVYLHNDNQRGTLGQAYLLGIRAGLPLWDMEMVQFLPLVMRQPGLPALAMFPPYPEQTRLLNAAGEDLLAKHGLDNLPDAFRKQRDGFSLMVHQEGQSGPVYLDFTRVPASDFDKYPTCRLKALKFDFLAHPVEVGPATHFFMGGLATDRHGATELPGLFACGEVAWGLHGANRRGGNALTEAAAMGLLAGTEAARHAAQHKTPANLPPAQEPAPVGPDRPVPPLRELRRRLREIAWQRAGLIRDLEGLAQGMKEIDALEGDLAATRPASRRQEMLRESLRAGCLAVKAVLSASQGRKESRGSFVLTELPEQDDAHWLRNSRLTYDPQGGGFALDWREVASEA